MGLAEKPSTNLSRAFCALEGDVGVEEWGGDKWGSLHDHFKVIHIVFLQDCFYQESPHWEGQGSPQFAPSPLLPPPLRLPHGIQKAPEEEER